MIGGDVEVTTQLSVADIDSTTDVLTGVVEKSRKIPLGVAVCKMAQCFISIYIIILCIV